MGIAKRNVVDDSDFPNEATRTRHPNNAIVTSIGDCDSVPIVHGATWPMELVLTSAGSSVTVLPANLPGTIDFNNSMVVRVAD
jgi:hypothetical protein